MQQYDQSAKVYLAENLKIIISIWKIDQSQFADLIGLNYATVNNYFNRGAFPRIPTLLVISDITGIPIDFFLRGNIPVGMIPDKPILQPSDEIHEPAAPYGPHHGILKRLERLESQVEQILKERPI